jgi:hypothetical protein
MNLKHQQRVLKNNQIKGLIYTKTKVISKNMIKSLLKMVLMILINNSGLIFNKEETPYSFLIPKLKLIEKSSLDSPIKITFEEIFNNAVATEEKYL